MAKSPEYSSWKAMKRRCFKSSDSYYHCYGARGITVCKRWLSFDNFYADMGAKPSPSHSLDRIDVNGNYEPTNCRWATAKQQSNNKRATTHVTFEGQNLSLKEWSDGEGFAYATIQGRLKTGWSLNSIINTPILDQREAARRAMMSSSWKAHVLRIARRYRRTRELWRSAV